MTVYSLTWLPAVLKDAGLKVALEPGWESRGHGDVGSILGIVCHHTSGPAKGNMPSLRVVRDGREDLPGPLAQLGLGRDGTYYVIAAGRCSHAGRGEWKGITTGNSNFIGIEAEHTGKKSEPWPAVQMDAYRRGVAAILRHIGRGADSCAGHKEYALPKGRKPDPEFDMVAFRSAVGMLLSGAVLPPVVIPAEEPGGARRPTLRRGDNGPLVLAIQTKLGVTPRTGFFGPKTEAMIRELQRQNGLVPDGIVGPKTWEAVDRV